MQPLKSHPSESRPVITTSEDRPIPDDNSDPLTNVFELQRTAIEQSRDAFEQMIEFQLQFTDAAVSGTEATGELYLQGIETSRRALHSYLDAVEATLPRSDDAVAQIRETIDAQFDQLEDQQREAMTMIEERVEDTEDASEAYLDSLDDQLDVLIDSHEQTEERTAEVLERIETQAERVQEEGQEQVVRQAEELQERVQDLQDRMRSTSIEE